MDHMCLQENRHTVLMEHRSQKGKTILKTFMQKKVMLISLNAALIQNMHEK